MSASRTLRGEGGVSEQTRARVQQAAEELGYRRNASARSLRLDAGSDLVGVVVTHLANPFYARLTLGVQMAVESRGMRVLLANTEESSERERELIQNLLERRVDGMVVVPSGYDHEHLDPQALQGTPVVLASRPPSGPDLDCVLVDDFGGARQATLRLLEEGHRRIGFVGNPPAVYTGAERYRGYCAALEESSLKESRRYVDRSAVDAASAERSAIRMLSFDRPPTAFFATNNRLALGVLRAVRCFSSEVSLAAFDDLEYADLLDRRPALVGYDAEEVGRKAGELLVRRMDERGESRDRAASRVVVPVTLANGGRGSTDTDG